MAGICTSKIIFLPLVAACAAYSQGTVDFVNYNTAVTPIIDARIWYAAGGPMPSTWVDSAVTVTDPLTQITYGGSSVRVGLYGGPAGSKEKNLVLLAPLVGFGTGPNAGYLASGPDTTRALPGLAPGEAAVLQLRGWDTGLAPGEITSAQSWEEANQLALIRSVYMGKSHLIDVSALGGAGSPPTPPAELFGLNGFDLAHYVPEPSLIALGIVSAMAGLLFFPRRRP